MNLANIRIGDKAGVINNAGRLIIGVDNGRYQGCRLAFLYMLGRWPYREVDHRNDISHDDRWKNLRDATRTQNQANGTYSNETGVRGVYRTANGLRFYAKIKNQRRQQYLGRYDTIEEASGAYRKAAEMIHGEFARHLSQIEEK